MTTGSAADASRRSQQGPAASSAACLLAELDTFYGDTPAETPDERAGQVRAALFSDPPAARVLLA
jgi:hypothetical protein